MSEKDKKEESWIQKLPMLIVVMAVVIFVIVVIRDHNQYIKLKEDQAELAGKVQQTSKELTLLQEASGTLDEVTKKVESLAKKAADTTAVLEKLNEEKNATDLTLSKLRQELNELNGQIAASKDKVVELMHELETLQTTNQQLRSDIVNKKNVLDSIAFLQRQKTSLEQKIQDLQTRYDHTVKTERELQASLEDLQKKISVGTADIQAQNEQRTALNIEVSELTETLEKLSLQKEKLEMWDDQQKRLEYIEYLKQQKESLEISINNLLEAGKKLEEKNSNLQ